MFLRSSFIFLKFLQSSLLSTPFSFFLWTCIFKTSSYFLFPGLKFFESKIKASYFSAARLLINLFKLLAAGIIMKQIAAMEVAHTSYVLEQQ